jgi:hypothetical protein
MTAHGSWRKPKALKVTPLSSGSGPVPVGCWPAKQQGPLHTWLARRQDQSDMSPDRKTPGPRLLLQPRQHALTKHHAATHGHSSTTPGATKPDACWAHPRHDACGCAAANGVKTPALFLHNLRTAATRPSCCCCCCGRHCCRQSKEPNSSSTTRRRMEEPSILRLVSGCEDVWNTHSLPFCGCPEPKPDGLTTRSSTAALRSPVLQLQKAHLHSCGVLLSR